MDQQGKRMSGLNALIPHSHTTTSTQPAAATGHSAFSFLSPLHQVFNPKKKTAEEKAAEDRSRENSMYLGRNFARARSSFMPLKPARPARDVEVAPNLFLSGSIGTKPKQPVGKQPYKAGSASRNSQQPQPQHHQQPQSQQHHQQQQPQLQNQSSSQAQNSHEQGQVYNNNHGGTQGAGQHQNILIPMTMTTITTTATTSTLTAASMDMSFDSPSSSSSVWKDMATPWKETQEGGGQYDDGRYQHQQQQPQYQPQPQHQPQSYAEQPQSQQQTQQSYVSPTKHTTMDTLIPHQYQYTSAQVPIVTMPSSSGTLAATTTTTTPATTSTISQGGVAQHGSQQEAQPGSQPTLSIPLPPPPPQNKYTSHIDPTSGHTYYYNAETGTSTWENPYPDAIQPSTVVASSSNNSSSSSSNSSSSSSSNSFGSPGGQNSYNGGTMFTPARSVIRAPLPRLTCPHGKIKPLRGGMVDEGESFLDIDGRWRSQSFTGDASIFTKGIGRNLFIGAKITKMQFLTHREGVVRWYRRLKEEEFWKDVDEDEKEPIDHVQLLVQKFTNILEVIEITGSASGVRGEGFAFDKVYSMNEIAYFYHPQPTARSPFKNKGLHNAGDLLDRHKEAVAKGNPRDILAEMHRLADLDDEKQREALEQQALDLDALGLGLGPRRPGQCDKQIAKEKLFLTELFLPLGQEGLSDELLDFVKSEVTRELNTKIVNLYEDEELSIIDKDTFDRALSAYLRTEKLRRHMSDLRDSLLKFVKDNMPLR